MADYIVYGKKGNGKSLICIARMRQALLEGRTVATNLNITIENLLPHGTRKCLLYRLPDRPTIDDLRMLGRGSDSDSPDESTYGDLYLDECASMLNARTFNDKGRQAVLDWFVHSRKLRWNTHFICQNPNQIDKQVREALVDLSVSCKRMDKVRIPFIGVLSKNLLGHEIRPPKFHIATVRYGTERDALISDRWTYTGTSLYSAYDTEQVFREDYEHGLFCYLTPWHLVGRYSGAFSGGWLARCRARLRTFTTPRPKPPAPPKSDLILLLERLPPAERLKHWRRFNQLGAV